MEKDRYLLSSLNNALCLLDLLSHASSLLGRTNSFVRNGQSQCISQSVHIEKNGYVQKLPEARYRLGMKFLYYGNLVAAQQDIVTAARPALQNLTCGASWRYTSPASIRNGLSLFVRRNLPMTFR